MGKEHVKMKRVTVTPQNRLETPSFKKINTNTSKDMTGKQGLPFAN